MPMERACTEATAPTTALIFSKIKYFFFKKKWCKHMKIMFYMDLSMGMKWEKAKKTYFFLCTIFY